MWGWCIQLPVKEGTVPVRDRAGKRLTPAAWQLLAHGTGPPQSSKVCGMDLQHFLAEQRLTEGSSFDEAWVKGIRKWWKTWSSRGKRFEGRYTTVGGLGHRSGLEHLDAAGAAAKAYLTEGHEMVERLKTDLLVNKGFWHVPDKKADKGMLAREWKTKTVQEIDEARKLLVAGVRAVEFWSAGGYDAGPHMSREQTELKLRDIEKVNRMISTINAAVDEVVERVDKIISGRLLRHLTKLAKMGGWQDNKVDLGGHEPEAVTLGKAQLIFMGTPKGKATASARHPRMRKRYIAFAQDVRNTLRKHNLGYLWYGKFFTKAKGDAPENHLGVHFGVGATYSRKGDYITVYADPKRSMAFMLIHELGHRYYYKFMNATDRHNFDRWFGKTKPTSNYGATISSEDFAEVFASYVTGRNISRDQAARLKEFFGRTKRLESLSVPDRIATMELQCFLTESRRRRGRTLVRSYPT